jgi:hypothetical protein
LAWRIDVRTLSKQSSSAEGDEPIAFFEMSTSQNKSAFSSATVSSTAKFEMNRQEVGAMLDSLNEIQEVFETAR